MKGEIFTEKGAIRSLILKTDALMEVGISLSEGFRFTLDSIIPSNTSRWVGATGVFRLSCNTEIHHMIIKRGVERDLKSPSPFLSLPLEHDQLHLCES